MTLAVQLERSGVAMLATRLSDLID